MRISEGVGWGTISLLCRKSVFLRGVMGDILLLCQNNYNMAKKESKQFTSLRRYKVQNRGR